MVILSYKSLVAKISFLRHFKYRLQLGTSANKKKNRGGNMLQIVPKAVCALRDSTRRVHLFIRASSLPN